MKERPILFSGPMVRATFEGRKTQTRRVMKPQPYIVADGWMWAKVGHLIENLSGTRYVKSKMAPLCPYGAPGDRLYVRETHYRYGKWLKNGKTSTGRQKWRFKPLNNEIHFDTDDLESLDIRPTSYRKQAWYKRPSIFLPKGYQRINLEITAIRVERVQEISEEDALNEGIEKVSQSMGRSAYPIYGELFDKLGQLTISPQYSFQCLWDSINAKRGYPWKDNPWVWVVEFKRVTE